MGAEQSKQAEATIHHKLLERLQAFNMHDHKYLDEKHDRFLSERDDYVVVGGEEARMSFAQVATKDDHA